MKKQSTSAVRGRVVPAIHSRMTRTHLRPRTAIKQRLNASFSHQDIATCSSGMFSLTVLGDLQDVLACVRTTILLSKCSGLSITIQAIADLPPIHLEPRDALEPSSRKKLLRSIKTSLAVASSSPPDRFRVETDITSASFLSISSISLRIRVADPVSNNRSIRR